MVQDIGRSRNRFGGVAADLMLGIEDAWIVAVGGGVHDGELERWLDPTISSVAIVGTCSTKRCVVNS